MFLPHFLRRLAFWLPTLYIVFYVVTSYELCATPTCASVLHLGSIVFSPLPFLSGYILPFLKLTSATAYFVSNIVMALMIGYGVDALFGNRVAVTPGDDVMPFFIVLIPGAIFALVIYIVSLYIF